MGRKGGGKGFQKNKKDAKNPKTSSRYQQNGFSSDDMDDEIDAFHKQRDVIPLDIHGGAEESDDDEIPVLNVKDTDDSEDEDSDSDEVDDDEYDDDDRSKMIRQQKYLRAKFGNAEDDDMHDDEDDDEDHGFVWGRKHAHGADNRNFELQSSDDEAAKQEEELALQIQRQKAKKLTMEDYDLVDISEEDTDNAVKDVSDEVKGTMKSLDRDITFTVEDLNALSKEEQMNVLYRSAPELVGCLSELNEAHKQLECIINPILNKVKKGELAMEGGVHYFELKQLLLLCYCQAITFYLLLKSEGQPVHDHPVMVRLEEIKGLLDQIKKLDAILPIELEDILNGSNGFETLIKADSENAPMTTDVLTEIQEDHLVSAEAPEAVPRNVVEKQKRESFTENVQPRKDKHKKDHIGLQSLEMLKVRASLEEKLKQKGLYSSVAPKPNSILKRSRPVNGQLETYDDFDDDTVDVKGEARLVNSSSKVSQYLTANVKKQKVISGDDDLPKRDDIGERRRKHELRVLAGAGVKNEDDDDDEVGGPGTDEAFDEEDDDDVSGDSENEFYKQVEQQQAAKLAAKAEIYTRKPSFPSLPETVVEGKRNITYQMVKNRGLTRRRNKDKKNPRKNYRDKHKKAVKNRKGQVQNIRRPEGRYGGEATGINTNVSRSIRFKS